MLALVRLLSICAFVSTLGVTSLRAEPPYDNRPVLVEHFEGTSLSDDWLITAGTSSNFSVSDSRLTALSTVGGRLDGPWRIVELEIPFLPNGEFYLSASFSYVRTPYKELDINLKNQYGENFFQFRIWDSPSHWILINSLLPCYVELPTDYAPHEIELYVSNDKMYLRWDGAMQWECDQVRAVTSVQLQFKDCPEYGGSVAGISIDSIYGSIPCCGYFSGGFTGNTDCDEEGAMNLADITRLIDNVYLSKLDLCCHSNGNVDGSKDGKCNLSDITALIDHIYLSKQSTAPCP